ncbi:uncharacterized protein PHALS_09748 [Plasmopara halstedii]|uniref:Uncharacterized protein n=1 Tax=Plasmopara halstedii TaxID=4781 RepID=A0A0P1AFU2_PLAHL|nr:uncharacterized protein PHALS_09748 [Plasmopara halstedii]CEG39505.1 hypothetical protein PHALS_09748 [Plasmopara halstedii]|eukprot:XP_024575874.1 hypothetical protein PHALS_09748 [Plasmopara halstedii]
MHEAHSISSYATPTSDRRGKHLSVHALQSQASNCVLIETTKRTFSSPSELKAHVQGSDVTQ